jgi:AAA domain
MRPEPQRGDVRVNPGPGRQCHEPLPGRYSDEVTSWVTGPTDTERDDQAALQVFCPGCGADPGQPCKRRQRGQYATCSKRRAAATKAEHKPTQDIWSIPADRLPRQTLVAARRQDMSQEQWDRLQATGAWTDRAHSNGDGDGQAPSVVKLIPASSVAMDRPRWTWERRIPVGGTTLMPGREGLGKTALVCWVSARLSRGDLHGERFGRPADIIYIGQEDDRATVTVPRLVAAGADLERFLFVDLPDSRPFSIGVDIDELAVAARGRDVALVVLDPLDSHLGSVDSHRKAEVQAAIARLAALAQQLRCGALGLAHLNKGDVRDLLGKVVGSVGFTTSVRSVLGVGEHPQNEGERVCVVGKANMTGDRDVPAIRFKIDKALVPHPTEPDPIDTARVVVLGEQWGIDPNSIIVGNTEDRTALEEAVDWLRDVLSDSPQARAELVKLAKPEGITEMTLKRASQRLRVIKERDATKEGRPSTWSLPEYGSTSTGQEGVTRTPQASDQHKHGEKGEYGSQVNPDLYSPEIDPSERF